MRGQKAGVKNVYFCSYIKKKYKSSTFDHFRQIYLIKKYFIRPKKLIISFLGHFKKKRNEAGREFFYFLFSCDRKRHLFIFCSKENEAIFFFFESCKYMNEARFFFAFSICIWIVKSGLQQSVLVFYVSISSSDKGR